MAGRTAFIFPGQGSQYVGMGKYLWDYRDDVRKLYKEASEASGIDLAGVSFEGPQEKLDSDVTAQLAVYVCNEAHRLAAAGLGLSADAVTGYSLGFYSALVCAGCIDFYDGLSLVKHAGELAVESSAANPGTMGAVIGLDIDDVERICGEASEVVPGGGVWVSNVNAARQILVSGGAGAVGRAVELALEKGALSAFVLTMGAAYHSPMMEDAAKAFAGHAGRAGFDKPGLPLISYLDARYVEDAGDISETVATQICRKVLWKDTVMRLIQDGVTRFIEVGPGSALTRMVRWVDRSVDATSIESLLQPASPDKGTGS